MKRRKLFLKMFFQTFLIACTTLGAVGLVIGGLFLIKEYFDSNIFLIGGWMLFWIVLMIAAFATLEECEE